MRRPAPRAGKTTEKRTLTQTRLTIAALVLAAAACLAVMALLRRPSAAPPVHPPAVSARAPAGPVRTAAPAATEAPAAGVLQPGLDAQQYMEGLAREAEAAEQALRDLLLTVAEADAATLDARLELYRSALDSARAAAPEAPLFQFPSMLAEVFLRMQSVQRELAALGPGARATQLAKIRRDLGFAEEEIARMEAIDQRRDARWQTGLAYMQERARLTATFEGLEAEALEAELRSLREGFFAAEASTIEAEERGGFYRFERPRVYGRN